MPKYCLPEPRLSTPLSPVDPYRHRRAFVELLSGLYHAEAAALEGFSLLSDPRYVQAHELFAKASRKLVADEQKHLEDFERIIASLTDRGVAPPTPAAARFWTAWRSGKLFALPFKPAVASLFCLFSEGLGYAPLYHLADVTTDAEIRAALRENVIDEQAHLRLSIHILQQSLERDPNGFVADFLVYGVGYALLAKDAVRESRPIVEEVGLDFEAVFASSIEFVSDLLMIVADQSGHCAKLFGAFQRFARLLSRSSTAASAAFASTYLPEPPMARSFVHTWGRFDHAVTAFRQSGATPIDQLVASARPSTVGPAEDAEQAA
jgi:hypothetical protein